MIPDLSPESRTHPSVLLFPKTSFGLKRSLRSGPTRGLCVEHSWDIVQDVWERTWRWSVNSSNQGSEDGPARFTCCPPPPCVQPDVRLLTFL